MHLKARQHYGLAFLVFKPNKIPPPLGSFSELEIPAHTILAIFITQNICHLLGYLLLSI